MKKMQKLIIKHAHEQGTHADGRRWYKANRCSVGLEFGSGAYDTEERMVNAGLLTSNDFTMHCVLTLPAGAA